MIYLILSFLCLVFFAIFYLQPDVPVLIGIAYLPTAVLMGSLAGMADARRYRK